MKKTLLIIPAYNEALNIERVINDITQNSDYDYLILNDGSKDNTEEICIRNNFNFVTLPVNYGLTSAVQLGFKYAFRHNYDIVVQFDGDGQHKAKFVKNLIDEIEQGNDVVIGSRFLTEKKPFTSRMLGSRVISSAIYLTTLKKIKDPTSGMRAFNKRIIPEFAFNINYPPEPDSLVYLLKRGFKIKETQVKIAERKAGESYLTTIKSIEYMMKMIISIIVVQQFRKR